MVGYFQLFQFLYLPKFIPITYQSYYYPFGSESFFAKCRVLGSSGKLENFSKHSSLFSEVLRFPLFWISDNWYRTAWCCLVDSSNFWYDGFFNHCSIIPVRFSTIPLFIEFCFIVRYCRPIICYLFYFWDVSCVCFSLYPVKPFVVVFDYCVFLSVTLQVV